MKRCDLEERVKKEALYIIKSDSNIRETAKYFGYSKSTISRDMSEILKGIDLNLYNQVKIVMDRHMELRTAKSGEATRQKYKIEKENKHGNKL